METVIRAQHISVVSWCF